MNRAIVLALLLAGCAAAPVARKPAPMPPPLPSPTSRPLIKDARRLLPPLPHGMRTAAFAPVAAVAPQEPEMGIYPFGAGYYLVTALQRAGTTLEMQWSDSMGQPWNFLAGYGYSAEEQWVSAAIPDHWLPYHRMFVRALMLPQAAPATLALRKSSPEIYTTHKVQIKGVVYRLVDISPPGTKFRLYKLVK